MTREWFNERLRKMRVSADHGELESVAIQCSDIASAMARDIHLGLVTPEMIQEAILAIAAYSFSCGELSEAKRN